MFTESNILKTKLRSFSLRLLNKLENNGNAHFDSNGEKYFLDSLMSELSHAGDGHVIFDIGANVGDYSLMISDVLNNKNVDAEIHLFEPTKSCFKIIQEKFNNINNVYLNNFGASDRDGEARIFYDKEQSGLASLYQRNLDSYNLSMNQSELISLRRLDTYIESEGIKHVDFIKIDIEGHELSALEGFGSFLNADFVDYIQFEYGGANLDSHTSLMEIYKFLTDRGFSIAKVMPSGLEIREYKPFMDNFMYANYVAISNRVVSR